MDERRELDWVRWRDGVDAVLEHLKQSVNLAEVRILSERLSEVMRRLDQVEKKVFNGNGAKT